MKTEFLFKYTKSVQHAIWYRKVLGWVVIPTAISLQEKKNVPLIKWKKFTSIQNKPSVDDVAEYFSKYPGANIALVLGKVSGVVVIDVDTGEVPDFLKRINTWIVKSKRGYHFYFSVDREVNTTVIENKIELKAEGSLVTLPLSFYPKDESLQFRYEWLIPPWDVKRKRFNELADFNVVVSHIFANYYLKEKVRKIENLASLYEGVPEGKRNVVLTKIAGSLFNDGLNEKEVFAVLKLINERNRPPLPEREVETIVKSIAKIRERQQRIFLKYKKLILEEIKNISGNFIEKIKEIRNRVSQEMLQEGLRPKDVDFFWKEITFYDIFKFNHQRKVADK